MTTLPAEPGSAMDGGASARPPFAEVLESPSRIDESRARWLAFVAENLFAYELSNDLPWNSDFRVGASSRNVDGFTLARVRTAGGASQLKRRSSDIGFDGQDRICLYLPIAGRIALEQLGRSAQYGHKEMALVAASEPLEHTKFGDNDTLCFLLPRAFVDQRVVHPEEICVRPMGAGHPMGGLVRDTLLSLYDSAPRMDDTQFKSSAWLVGELVLLALGGAKDLLAGATSVRQANLARAKRIIRRRMVDYDLSIGDIANECGFSVSYLHNLFRDEGRSVGAFLTQERLNSARAMLEQAESAGARVTDVALSCGYSNMSQFSTAFKRAFGVSPREVLLQPRRI